MGDFTFRKKTFQTPKANKTNEAPVNSTSNAVTRSEFKRRTKAIAYFDEREEADAEPLAYHVPFALRRKKTSPKSQANALEISPTVNPPTPESEERELPVPRKLDLDFDSSTSPQKDVITSAEPPEPTQKKKRGRPPKKKVQEPPKEVVTKGKDLPSSKGKSKAEEEEEKDESGPESSPLKRQKLDDSVDSLIPSSPLTNSDATPVKGTQKQGRNLQEFTSLQKYWKHKLDDEMKRVTLRFQGTRSGYLIQNLEIICSRFLDELATLPEDTSSPVPISAKKSKSKSKIPKAVTGPNPRNLELEKRERMLKRVIESLTEEDKEWEELLKEHSTQPPKTKIKVSISDEIQQDSPKITPSKSLETLTLQVDELKPILKDMKHFNTIADKFCSDMATTLTNKGFANYGKADPKELIRSLAYAEDL